VRDTPAGGSRGPHTAGEARAFEFDDADPEDLQRCLRGMRDAAEDWEVSGYTKYTDRFESVDANDRHVAAAAYKLSLDDWPGQPVVLVTKNVSDFPQSAFQDT
jgi:hypothetical protein